MTYLLDTNVVIAMMAGHAEVVRKMQVAGTASLFVPTIVMHELYFGAYKSQRSVENLRRIDALRLNQLDFDAMDARCAAELRLDLQKTGTPIGPYDTLIAGQALARDLTLVTRNTREFARIAGLRVENWQD